MVKRIDHFVITTNYLEDCIDFYTALGFTVRQAGERFELFSGDFKINVHLPGKELQPHAAKIMSGSADICFEVEDDLDTAAGELRKKGLKIELEKSTRHGFRGEMSSVYLRDPDGNLVELCQYPG